MVNHNPAKGHGVLGVLLLDVGNSSVKWALFDGKQFWRRGDLPREEHRQLLEALPTPEAIWIASVADDRFNQTLTESFARRWHLFPKFVKSRREGFGVKNGYAEPERLGVDRWLALIAAFRYYRNALPALIADCGTAVTLDLLKEDGRHLGGYLLPGIELMINSLLVGASQVRWERPVVERFRSFRPGRSTEEGLFRGSLLAIVSAIMRARPRGWSILLTGGNAPLIGDYLRADHIEVPDLVLKGLAVVAAATEPE